MNGWTNYHCHTSFVDPDVDREMTPAYYAGLLGERLRRVVLELNSHAYVPEAATVRMLKFAADRGLPVVIGTDAHTRDRILAFEAAEQRLALAGLTAADLFIPQVEDFMARKGRRHDAKSRPAPGRRVDTGALKKGGG